MSTTTETPTENTAHSTADSHSDLGPATRPRAHRPTSRDTVGELSTVQLEDELTHVAHYLAEGTYQLLVLVGEYDVRGTWALHGALTCAAWLADLCDIETCTARTQIRVAKALRDHPRLDAAMRDGDLSYAKARVLIPWIDDTNVDELVAIAASTSAGRLGAAIAAWAHRNDDQTLIEAHQRAVRSCTWRTEPDGTVTITTRLTPAAAGAVCAAIDARHDECQQPGCHARNFLE